MTGWLQTSDDVFLLLLDHHLFFFWAEDTLVCVADSWMMPE